MCLVGGREAPSSLFFFHFPSSLKGPQLFGPEKKKKETPFISVTKKGNKRTCSLFLLLSLSADVVVERKKKSVESFFFPLSSLQLFFLFSLSFFFFFSRGFSTILRLICQSLTKRKRSSSSSSAHKCKIGPSRAALPGDRLLYSSS